MITLVPLPDYGPDFAWTAACSRVLALDDQSAACLATLPWRLHPQCRLLTDAESRPYFDGNGPRCRAWDEAFWLFVSVGRLDAPARLPLHRRLLGSAPGGSPLHLAIVLPPEEPLPPGDLRPALAEIAGTADAVLLVDPALLPAGRRFRRRAPPLARIVVDAFYGCVAPLDIRGQIYFSCADWLQIWGQTRFWTASSAFGRDLPDVEELGRRVADGLSLLLDGRAARGATSTALWAEASALDLSILADGFRDRLSMDPDRWPGRADVLVPGLRGLGLVGFAGLGDDPEPVANVLARLGWERA